MTKIKKTPEEETLERVRRIETRVTTLAIALGVTTPHQQPSYTKEPGEHAVVHLPSPHSSITEIMAALPGGFTGRFAVTIGDRVLATMDVADRT